MIWILSWIVPPKRRARFVPLRGLTYSVDGVGDMVVERVEQSASGIVVHLQPIEEYKR